MSSTWWGVDNSEDHGSRSCFHRALQTSPTHVRAILKRLVVISTSYLPPSRFLNGLSPSLHGGADLQRGNIGQSLLRTAISQRLQSTRSYGYHRVSNPPRPHQACPRGTTEARLGEQEDIKPKKKAVAAIAGVSALVSRHPPA
jgi:hypothetical protein